MRNVPDRPTDGDRAARDRVAIGDAPPSAAGLTAEEAARRLAVGGANELPTAPPPSILAVVRDQFTDTITAVLVAAGLVTWLTGDRSAAVVIVAVLLGNATIGFTQQRRAQHALEALAELSAPFATVVRDGVARSVPAATVVPGDLIDVQAGDLVPSDAHLVEAAALQVDESALTGESVPTDKRSHAEAPADTPARGPVATDRIFLGTSVTHGRGRGEVVATGPATELGRVADLLRPRATVTPLQRRLAVLGRRIAALAVGLCGVIFLLGVLRGEPAEEMVVVAASVAVAAIPESLPAVVTVALALGAERMARRHAIVRRLLAVETLGSVTVICTDKTGTLTEGTMAVEQAWAAGRVIEVVGSGYAPVGSLVHDGAALEAEATDGSAAALRLLARAAASCNDATLVPPSGPAGPTGGADRWSIVGDPTEAALAAFAGRAGVDLDVPWTRLAEVPFDSRRRRMTTVHADPAGRTWAFTKGAVEVVLDLAVDLQAPDGVRRLTPEDRAQVERVDHRWAAAGHRVLALAGRSWGAAAPAAPDVGLTFYGLVALADPPRTDAAAAIADARRAGIHLVMITGDHPVTAMAIAERLGLHAGTVVTGADLPSDPTELAAVIAGATVFARISAEQKLAIVRSLQHRGEIVAMTGDGVNDAPALQQADIGVAMGRNGTEVSKAAADLVLADDDVATIVHAVAEGRRIHDNIRRFVRYGLIGGSAEIIIMLVGPFLGLEVPLLPVQILWVNLLTHGVPGVALAAEEGDGGELQRPPRPPSEALLDRRLFGEIALFGTVTAAAALGLARWAEGTGRPWQTMLFVALTGMQLGVALATRSDQLPPWRVSWRANRLLGWSLLGTVGLQLAALSWPVLTRFLGLERLGLADLAIVLATSLTTAVAIEARRRLGAGRR